MRTSPESRLSTMLLGDHVQSVWTRATYCDAPQLLVAVLQTCFNWGLLSHLGVSVVIKIQ